MTNCVFTYSLGYESRYVYMKVKIPTNMTDISDEFIILRQDSIIKNYLKTRVFSSYSTYIRHNITNLGNIYHISGKRKILPPFFSFGNV